MDPRERPGLPPNRQLPDAAPSASTLTKLDRIIMELVQTEQQFHDDMQALYSTLEQIDPSALTTEQAQQDFLKFKALIQSLVNNPFQDMPSLPTETGDEALAKWRADSITQLYNIVFSQENGPLKKMMEAIQASVVMSDASMNAIKNALLKNGHENSAGDPLIAGHFMKPMQRLLKYPLLMNDLRKKLMGELQGELQLQDDFNSSDEMEKKLESLQKIEPSKKIELLKKLESLFKFFEDTAKTTNEERKRHEKKEEMQLHKPTSKKSKTMSAPSAPDQTKNMPTWVVELLNEAILKGVQAVGEQVRFGGSLDFETILAVIQSESVKAAYEARAKNQAQTLQGALSWEEIQNKMQEIINLTPINQQSPSEKVATFYALASYIKKINLLEAVKLNETDDPTLSLSKIAAQMESLLSQLEEITKKLSSITTPSALSREINQGKLTEESLLFLLTLKKQNVFKPWFRWGEPDHRNTLGKVLEKWHKKYEKKQKKKLQRQAKKAPFESHQGTPGSVMPSRTSSSTSSTSTLSGTQPSSPLTSSTSSPPSSPVSRNASRIFPTSPSLSEGGGKPAAQQGPASQTTAASSASVPSSPRSFTQRTQDELFRDIDQAIVLFLRLRRSETTTIPHKKLIKEVGNAIREMLIQLNISTLTEQMKGSEGHAISSSLTEQSLRFLSELARPNQEGVARHPFIGHWKTWGSKEDRNKLIEALKTWREKNDAFRAAQTQPAQAVSATGTTTTQTTQAAYSGPNTKRRALQRKPAKSLEKPKTLASISSSATPTTVSLPEPTKPETALSIAQTLLINAIEAFEKNMAEDKPRTPPAAVSTVVEDPTNNETAPEEKQEANNAPTAVPRGRWGRLFSAFKQNSPSGSKTSQNTPQARSFESINQVIKIQLDAIKNQNIDELIAGIIAMIDDKTFRENYKTHVMKSTANNSFRAKDIVLNIYIRLEQIKQATEAAQSPAEKAAMLYTLAKNLENLHMLSQVEASKSTLDADKIDLQVMAKTMGQVNDSLEKIASQFLVTPISKLTRQIQRQSRRSITGILSNESLLLLHTLSKQGVIDQWQEWGDEKERQKLNRALEAWHKQYLKKQQKETHLTLGDGPGGHRPV